MSDGQHWYTPAGEACHYVDGKPTTLREARKLKLVPSVSTVLSVLAKDGLTLWLIDQGILAALTLPRIDGETSEQLLSRIRADGRRQAQEAAEHGTAIHSALEAGFAGEAVPERFVAHWDAARQRLSELFPKVTDWVSEKRFSHPLGYGGTCDLHSPSTGIVVDFKTSDISPESAKRLAWEQFEQLAAYQRGLNLPRNIGCNLFLSRTHPGYIVSHIWDESEMDHGWDTFQAALRVWCLRKKYSGAWT